ncbi:hypothetical protein D3C76_1212660 [compost metagenome]
MPVGLELVLLERARVGFQRDLDVRRERDALFDTAQQAAQGVGAEQARGTAAEEDRADRTALYGQQFLVKVGQQGIDIGLFRQIRTGGMGIEVAIWAFTHAPRDVDVQRQRRQRGEARHAGLARLDRQLVDHARPRR